MARKRLYEYAFAPGTAGLGTVKVPDRYNLADILAIYDTTTNTCIYNFADTTLGGTIAWAAESAARLPDSSKSNSAFVSSLRHISSATPK